MAKVAYKAKYEEATARLTELETLVKQLVADKAISPQSSPSVKTTKVNAPKRQPKNEGVADSIVLINPESGLQADSIEEAIRSNEHGDQVNFIFAKVEGDEASKGKPIPSLLSDIQQTNADVPRKGYAHKAGRWYMERSRFDAFVKRNKVTVY
jgi:hypothetical protein